MHHDARRTMVAPPFIEARQYRILNRPVPYSKSATQIANLEYGTGLHSRCARFLWRQAIYIHTDGCIPIEAR